METAVEWLEKRFLETEGNLYAEDFTKAKEKEKQQIIDAYNQGSEGGYELAKNDDFYEGAKMKGAEQYYNETYKSE